MDIPRGNVTVRLYANPVRVGGKRYASWTVAWREESGRKRQRFHDHAAALQFAETKADLLDKGYKFHLSAEQMAGYNRAHDTLLPTGKTLESLALDYVAAWQIVPDVPLATLASFWARHHSGDPRVTPSVVVEELLATKRRDGLSPEYLHDLDVRLGRFAGDFNVPLVSLTSDVLSDWLASLKVSHRGRRNYLRAVGLLVNYAKERRYLPREWSELPKAGRALASSPPVEIYTPTDLRRLLAAARFYPGRHTLLPLLVFGAFAGLRTKEILRLDWSRVGLRYLDVTAKRTRSASRRLVPILPALKHWLALCRASAGPVCRYRRPERATACLADRAGVPWKHNALRHSFISYRVAQVRDVARVALECGNSAAMIFQHYRERVTPRQAAEWFGICRKSVTKKLLQTTKPL